MDVSWTVPWHCWSGDWKATQAVKTPVLAIFPKVYFWGLASPPKQKPKVVVIYKITHFCIFLLSLRRRRRWAPAEAMCFWVVRPCVRDSRGSFMFPRYLQYLLTDFRQIFVTGASWDIDDLITFLGQKVKVQGHTIAAKAHSTLRYRRVQLFLVLLVFHLSHLETWECHSGENEANCWRLTTKCFEIIRVV